MGSFHNGLEDTVLELCKEIKNGFFIDIGAHDGITGNNTEFLERLSSKFDTPFIIPEGGANEWGREGSTEITEYITDNYSHVCISVGTGTTLAGIRAALSQNIQVLGYVPMKGGVYLKEEINKYIELEKQDDYMLYDDWHSGGFGKWNDELIGFMNSFHAINDIPLDIVYTGKMMMGISEQLKSGYFPKNAKILCIHTGGLQGNSSVKHLLSY
jgi:1-aminocyclopropane-1-carboxylate deaminase